MLEAPLAPYLLWAKTRQPAAIDLAGSNLLHCTLDDLPGARDAVDLSAKNDNGYRPFIDGLAGHYRISPERVVTANGCSGANFVSAAAVIDYSVLGISEAAIPNPDEMLVDLLRMMIGKCREWFGQTEVPSTTSPVEPAPH